MTTEQYGPGKNGWPAHGFSGSPFTKLRCYCDEEFTSKMALNRHVEAEAVAAERARMAEAVRGLDELTGHMKGAYHDAYVQVQFVLDKHS